MRRAAMVCLLVVTAGCSGGTNGGAQPPSCPPGQTMCAGACVRTSDDPENCGACGTVCDATQVCRAGACQTSCPAGFIDCGGQCVDPQNDRTYCGAFGNCQGINAGTTCASGEVCTSGACAVYCPTGFVICDGRCVDPRNDRAYCGASGDCQGLDAGTSCPPGEVCNAGTCAVSCQVGLLNCNGACVDPLTSADHCGATGDCQGDHSGGMCGADEACAAGTCKSNDAALYQLETIPVPFNPPWAPVTLSPAFDPDWLNL